jgi:histidine ammonia-lyase
MGSIAARNAMTVLEHSERIVAIELICATQGLDLRLDLQPETEPGAGVAEARARIRAVIERLESDREPGPDLEAAFRLVHDGSLVDLAAPPAAVGTSWLGPDPR